MQNFKFLSLLYHIPLKIKKILKSIIHSDVLVNYNKSYSYCEETIMPIDRQTTTIVPYHNTNANILWSYKNHIFIFNI